MINRSVAPVLAVLASMSIAPGAQAQVVIPSVEVATDENRRGLSWSEGRATASADLAVEAGALNGGVRVSALRGSDLHHGAGAAIDLVLGTSHEVGPLLLSTRGTAHLFSGAAGKQDYGEIGASAAYTIGPLRVNAGADYAPHQDAIGGSNLYLFAGADAGIPATAWTIFGHVGRSSGDADGEPSGRRLRPDGSYTDWRIGTDYIAGPLVLAVEYIGTDIERTRLHDDRVVARARFTF